MTNTVDFTELRELCNEDRSFYREMLEIFVTSTKTGFRDIHEALSKKDYMMISEFAHRMCSPLRHLRTSTLLDYLKQIESMAKNKVDSKKIKLLIEEAENEAKEVFMEVEAEINAQ